MKILTIVQISTASTYKCGGPRGRVVIAGKKSSDLDGRNITDYIFPGLQSTPSFNVIASKSVFFKECATSKYRRTQEKIVQSSKSMAKEMIKKVLSEINTP